jgi:hypothetical protein
VNELKTKALLKLNSKTPHFGRPVEFLELENKLHKWVEEMRQEDIPVRTNNIIAQAMVWMLPTHSKRVMHSAYVNGYTAFLNEGTCPLDKSLVLDKNYLVTCSK